MLLDVCPCYLQCLHHLLNIDEAVSHLTDSLPLMKSFRQPVRTQLANLLNSIPAILDLDTSTASSCSSHPTHPVHLSIQYDIDPHLDQLKHQRTQLPHLLARLVANDSDDGGELEGLAGEFVYVYMQQVGFLVRMEVGQGWTGGDWLFEDGGYDFYKSERTRQLDAGQSHLESVPLFGCVGHRTALMLFLRVVCGIRALSRDRRHRQHDSGYGRRFRARVAESRAVADARD